MDRVPPEKIEEHVQALEREDYSIHFHVWAPEEFGELLRHARDERHLPFNVEALQPNHHEFVAVLRKT